MPTWKLTLEYHGAAFCGWQRQPNGVSVQQVLEEALAKLHPHASIRVTGAGRTDAGVHARGQVASFRVEHALPASAYAQGLNAHLPAAVAVREAITVPDAFDARRWSHGKRYVYRVLRARTRSPLRADHVWMVPGELDVEPMREAASRLLGVHDFSSFRGAGCSAKSTVRDLRRVDLAERDDELVLTFEATAFLRHMVRNLVGTLVEVGRGRRAATSMDDLLAARDRSLAGQTAPAQGLCLDEVFYDLAHGPPFAAAGPGADDDDD